MEGESREPAETPGEWTETRVVGAAWGTLSSARQETVVWRDASPSLCCPLPSMQGHQCISWPEEASQRFGKPLQCGCCGCCLVALKLSARWVSRGRALQPGLPFSNTLPPLHPRLSNARDTTAVLQSSPPSWVTLRSSSTSHCTSPRCHPSTALTLSRCVGPGCCRHFLRELWANSVRAHGADSMPPSLHPQYAVQCLAHHRLSPAPDREDHILSILP